MKGRSTEWQNSNQGGFCTALCFQWGVKHVPSRDILSEDIPSCEQCPAGPTGRGEFFSDLTECALCLGITEQDPLEDRWGKNTVTQPDFLSWLFPSQR